MKKLPENLKRAFSALEFTKVGNLMVLTTLLEQQERIAQTTCLSRSNTEPEKHSGSAGFRDITP